MGGGSAESSTPVGVLAVRHIPESVMGQRADRHAEVPRGLYDCKCTRANPSMEPAAKIEARVGALFDNGNLWDVQCKPVAKGSKAKAFMRAPRPVITLMNAATFRQRSQ